MIILIGKKSSRIDVDGLKNHYGRLLTWLDLQLITKGLVLIYDSFDLEGRSKNDLDFQKLAIANTWFSMSKTCNDLEDDILQVCKFLFKLADRMRSMRCVACERTELLGTEITI